ncbi:MAG: CehA/McbA family metallohydrolase [Acidobacteria bacterium]|nr:CehA/McbA family metallohydrolase [Acidobacteriota bacterium]
MPFFSPRSIRCLFACFAACLVWSSVGAAQSVPLQPFAQQVRRLEDALNYIGQPLPAGDHAEINSALAAADETQAAARIQEVLDRHVLAEVEINAESRVKVRPGKAKPELVEGGTRMFLVKVLNGAGVTAPLAVESPNSGPTSLRSRGEKEPEMELTQTDVKERWANLEMFNGPPMAERLSGLAVEYQILQVYSRDRGQRSAKIAFNVGQGTQDIGFRNDILVLFNIGAARPIKFHVKDENGQPTIASFTIKDLQGRIYPNLSKRLAPDFPFQPQVYRADGEEVRLPDGYYSIAYDGGPEFYTRTKELPVTESAPKELSFQLQRWIDPSKWGWWSGDHHVHASGCSHYKNPTEGVLPQDMIRQILGENLNIGAVLTWGPSWYYQKQFFSSQDNELSKKERLMHYDVEVSGFPSSHAGHLVLLGLNEDDYPGTTRVDEWPSWDLPVLQWGRKQGGIVGFSHSGWGLEVRTDELPNYEMPGFDGIGANEYVVDVTHDAVDFISTVDTPSVWELNIWYHTLNAGFRTRVSGETDFPCIYDDKVGLGRSYIKLDKLSYRGWIEGVKAGRCYVSEGKSHLMDFAVNGVEVGTQNSEIQLDSPQKVRVTAKVAAFLDNYPDPNFHNLGYEKKPYWDVERARIAETREVPVELVVNGESVATKNLLADGQVREMTFDVAIEKSSWIALRILPSSHTNPVFAVVGGKPIRASRRSAEWCLAAVNQCWSQKAPRIRESEREAARKAYDHAREVYRKRIAESGM